MTPNRNIQLYSLYNLCLRKLAVLRPVVRMFAVCCGKSCLATRSWMNRDELFLILFFSLVPFLWWCRSSVQATLPRHSFHPDDFPPGFSLDVLTRPPCNYILFFVYFLISCLWFFCNFLESSCVDWQSSISVSIKLNSFHIKSTLKM